MQYFCQPFICLKFNFLYKKFCFAAAILMVHVYASGTDLALQRQKWHQQENKAPTPYIGVAEGVIID